MGKFIDITGERFGRWTATKVDGVRNRLIYWKVVCECGNVGSVTSGNLRLGLSKSCGCYAIEAKRNRIKHGECRRANGKSKELSTWAGMKARCFNKNQLSYKRYGNRGITVCERWKDSFQNFLADMGRCPGGHSLERINNDGNYEPGNCRWATMEEQAKNKRKRIRVPYQLGLRAIVARVEDVEGMARAIMRELFEGYNDWDDALVDLPMEAEIYLITARAVRDYAMGREK